MIIIIRSNARKAHKWAQISIPHSGIYVLFLATLFAAICIGNIFPKSEIFDAMQISHKV